MSLSAGQLRHRVRIEQLVDLVDTAGETIQDPESGQIAQEWQLFAEMWASIAPLSVKEMVAAQAVQSQVVARIMIRYLPGVTAAMRAVHNGTIYNITGVLPDADSGLEYLTLPCSQGVSDGQGTSPTGSAGK